jgi:hypothetical protein
MTTKELLEYHIKLSQQAHAIMAKKNHDYSGAKGDNPFFNFEMSYHLGICTPEKAFLIRITDKLMRLITFANTNELKVTNESAEDACLDIINYCVLLSAYINQKKESKHDDRKQ